MYFKFILTFSLFIHPCFSEESDENNTKEDAKTRIEIAKLTQEANQNLKNRRWKDVEDAVKQIKLRSDNSADYHYLKAALSYVENNYQQSFLDLDNALRINPSHDPSHFLYGIIYSKLSLWDKAIPYFEKAAQFGTYNPFYRMNLTLAYYELENYEKAVVSASKTLELKENYYQAKAILARSLYKLGRKSESFQYVDQMIKQKEEYDQIFPIYIRLLYELKREYNEIIKILTTKKGLNFEEKKFLGLSYYKTGNYNKSYSYLKDSVNSGLDDLDENLAFISTCIRLSRDSEAQKFISNAYLKFPDSRKKILDTYINGIEERESGKTLYLPFPSK